MPPGLPSMLHAQSLGLPPRSLRLCLLDSPLCSMPGSLGLCPPDSPLCSMPGALGCAPQELRAVPLDSTPAPRSMPRAMGCPPGASGFDPRTPRRAPRPGASPVPCSGCVLRSPACSPCRAGIAGVCSSMDETLGATGILGLRKRFTCLAPGSSPAPTRWVAPAPLFGLRPARTPGLLILRGAHPCFRRPACPSRSSCSRRRRAARASTAQTSAGGRGRVRRWAGPGPDGVCTARVHPRVHFEAEDNMQNITQHCLQ